MDMLNQEVHLPAREVLLMPRVSRVQIGLQSPVGSRLTVDALCRYLACPVQVLASGNLPGWEFLSFLTRGYRRSLQILCQGEDELQFWTWLQLLTISVG